MATECASIWILRQKRPLGAYTHLAFTVPASAFEAAVSRLRAAQVQVWQKNKSPGDSFYFLDPDGHKLELYVATQQDRLKALLNNPPKELMLFPIP